VWVRIGRIQVWSLESNIFKEKKTMSDPLVVCVPIIHAPPISVNLILGRERENSPLGASWGWERGGGRGVVSEENKKPHQAPPPPWVRKEDPNIRNLLDSWVGLFWRKRKQWVDDHARYGEVFFFNFKNPFVGYARPCFCLSPGCENFPPNKKKKKKKNTD